MPSRDVEINLVGHDRTGHATRSAGNNLDQLARKIDKFNGKDIGGTNKVKIKTDVDNRDAGRAAGKLKRTFGKAGDDAGRSFASRFRNKLSRLNTSTITQRIKKVFTVDKEARNRGLTAGSAFFRSFINTVTLGMAGGQISGSLVKAAPKFAAAGAVLGAALVGALLVQIAQAVQAASSLILGAGLLALPVGLLIKEQVAASKDLEKVTTKIAAAEAKVASSKGKTRLEAQKELRALQFNRRELEKQLKPVEDLKTHWGAFRAAILTPIRAPFEKSLKAIGAGLDQLSKPLQAMLAALGTALPGFTKGIMNTFLAFINALKPALPSIVAGFTEWGRQMPRIGKAIGDFFAKITGSPAGAVGAVQGLTDSFVALVADGASIIAFFEDVASAYRDFSTTVQAFETSNFGMLGNLNTGPLRQFSQTMREELAADLHALDVFLSAWAKISPVVRPAAAAVHEAAVKAQNDLDAMKNKWAATDATFKAHQIKAKITADIAGLQAKLAIAKAKLKDPTLSKAKKVQIKADISDIRLKIATAKAKLVALVKKKNVSKLEATKKDLEAKIAAAKRSLDTVKNKKTEAKIKADIKQAQAAIARIKAQIAGVKGKTVTVRINQNTYLTRTVKTNRIVRVKDPGASAGSSWQGSLSGGDSSRTGGPTQVNVAAPTVDTRVFIDSREIRSVARSTVLDENRRNAYRARVGARR